MLRGPSFSRICTLEKPFRFIRNRIQNQSFQNYEKITKHNIWDYIKLEALFKIDLRQKEILIK